MIATNPMMGCHIALAYESCFLEAYRHMGFIDPVTLTNPANQGDVT
jgi:hypothetical protein